MSESSIPDPEERERLYEEHDETWEWDPDEPWECFNCRQVFTDEPTDISLVRPRDDDALFEEERPFCRGCVESARELPPDPEPTVPEGYEGDPYVF